MQQVRRPIVCASFSESNPLSAIPGLTALKSSPGMPIVTGYGRSYRIIYLIDDEHREITIFKIGTPERCVSIAINVG